jgi:two-component system nitrogen regulation sensor histidine kinase GlnL
MAQNLLFTCAPQRTRIAQIEMSNSSSHHYAGLDLLSTAVIILDHTHALKYANPAAETMFAVSQKNVLGQPFARLFSAHNGNAALFAMLDQVAKHEAGFSENELTLETAAAAILHTACTAAPADGQCVILEFHQQDQQMKIVREEKILAHQQLNRELIRNLAHEIKNPLGGIRGSAQLLERELPQNELKEYTQVIVKEADRLQALMDRLLTPHRLPKLVSLNIHELIERVLALVLAEFPDGISVVRDYDTSLPELIGEKELLIQALLNVARNAAQSMKGHGEIRIVTRIARQVTLARVRYRYAITIDIIDDGPGVASALRDKIFYPLVSGRDGGTGLGLSIAQDLVNQHQGIIEFDSIPGQTRFTVLLPVRQISSTPETSQPS